MKVWIAYGRSGLRVDLPDDRVDIIEPRDDPPVADEAATLQDSLRSPIGSRPLAELVTARDSVVIVVNEGTRPMPTARVLPTILQEIAVVPTRQITILVATGTHRANTVAELEEMLGAAYARSLRVINHDARDATMLRFLGRTARGHPIWLNRHYLDASVRISTGFIEPHFFAGFSGGPKPVMPGLAGLETVLYNHGPKMIADPRSAFGVLAGNPIHEEQREISLLAPPTFSVNVALNKEQRITGVWSGEMMAAHAAGVAFVRRTAIHHIPYLYDIVLTTNSGYPLDQNLYQAVKGMAAAARGVKPGGSIIIAAECSDGLPAHGRYAELLHGALDPETMLSTVERAPVPIADGWQAQIQAQLLRRADIALYSTLPDEAVRAAHLAPIHDIEAAVSARLAARGPASRVLVLPLGPLSIVEPSTS